MNTPAKKKSHKRKYEGDENQHRYSKSQKLVRERNRKAKLRKNPAMCKLPFYFTFILVKNI